MATRIFPPTIAGFMLCGILAAAITTIDTQILVSASTIAEDIYKKFFNRSISNRGLLHISRLGGLIITGISFWIAFYNTKSILDLVSQAWAGLGGAFGPIIVAIFILPYKINKWGALTGIITGGIIGGTWQLWGYTPLYPLIPAFIGGLIAIYAVTWLTHRRYNVNS
jgi:sodium/proline symporter